LGGQIFTLDGADGTGPDGGVTLAADGNFYGTANSGGSADLGVLFRVSAQGEYTDLHDFTGTNDGILPIAPPIQASDGNLYGGTDSGPGFSGMTVYRYSSTEGFSTLYTFDQAQGASILLPLVQASNGNLYGAFTGGGANSSGGIFEMTTSGVLLNLYSFPGGDGPSSPLGLLQAADGSFYGTTEIGGKKGYGTIFRMSPTGVVTLLYSFKGGRGDGKYPAGLMQATDGNLYGVTPQGGAENSGTIYQITTAGAYKLLYSFVPATGKYPGDELLQHTDGLFYGAAFEGGRQNVGSIYSLNMALSPFVAFVVPVGAEGQSAQILGQGFTGTTAVTFNGVPATSFKVASDTFLTAVVPSGATTGKVVVTTPGGALTSNVNFRIIN
jgi:uncharacterized repeat protein (TIGR03803 family)